MSILVLRALPQNITRVPEFEVASVKPTAPPAGPVQFMMRGGPGSQDPGRIEYTTVTLKQVLLQAYQIKSHQLEGPEWINTKHFNISAKLPSGTTKEDFYRMLQHLLATRFKVVVHRMAKERQVYVLVVGKNGLKMNESEPKDSSGFAPFAGMSGGGVLPPIDPSLSSGGQNGLMLLGPGHLQGRKMPLAQLASLLANQLDRFVVDETGLKGKYDFALNWTPGPTGKTIPLAGSPPETPTDNAGMPVNSMNNSQYPSIFVAVQEQLGLRLDPHRRSVDVVVIDHAEAVPTAN